MDNSFHQQNFPLGIQCGRPFWNAAGLTRTFRQPVRPTRTYLLHQVADNLRRSEPEGLSAAEFELWATLNQALLHIGRHHLKNRNCRFQRNLMHIGESKTILPGLDQLLQQFLDLFPTVAINLGEHSPEQALASVAANNQWEDLLLELYLLRVQSLNPALSRAKRLFFEEEKQLQKLSGYQEQLSRIDQLLPVVDDGFGSTPTSLFERLLEPVKRAATLRKQLLYLQSIWGAILPAELLNRIASAFVLQEQEGFSPGFPGEPEAVVLNPAAVLDEEQVNFTVDIEWMPRTVLLAKATYVWLHQLSAKYRWHIHRLDQIPDEELDEIASSGFTSLWLIGIWQRSNASKKIKHLCGQIQVAASAYAIDDYRVADDLGGQSALQNLRWRCQLRGVDLACDVVTNHTGIDSNWVRHHPEWFIQLPNPPYPGYRFTGPDLSQDDQFSVQIEDGYFDHSEAAVVCRYQHRHSGEVRYLYHGNDGTHLPWNDTVQLNYLLPDVREAMIQLILQVAKTFRVIRFDAAMTLAKRHFQRLWFPLPGGGAGVPSRADHALSQEDFNRLFPIEFWKELVDRVRDEAPNTLLIAEAFWLMEGYFVRTLGMHRVYNSAFMNMLKQEENAKYRQTLKNILAFDPPILQRFVNFMSNPDEKSAIDQFGKDEKYFCVATMLATMPGLPMFAHGQVEGFHEKYGMEYLAPRYQEQVDVPLRERHRRQIFPLLQQRALFSGSEHFQLYDFNSVYGVEENVFVYSNCLAERRVIVICNNSANQIFGQIGNPCNRSDGKDIPFVQACDLDMSKDYLILQDIGTGLQYLQPTNQLANGGQFKLDPYCHFVFGKFTAIGDQDGRWRELWERYGDCGHPDLFSAFDSLLLEPLNDLTQQLYDLKNPKQSLEEISRLSRAIFQELRTSQLQQLAPERFLELQIQTIFPEGPILPKKLRHELQQFLSFDFRLPSDQLFNILDRLFNRREWRKLLVCNFYNETDWFNKEAFDRISIIFFKYSIFVSHQISGSDSNKLEKNTLELLINMQNAGELAAKTGYQVDEFLHRLQGEQAEEKVLPAAPGGDHAMKILFVSPEATPFAKTGGLADVAGSLPRALRQLGHDVRVILPCHRSAERSGSSLRKGRKSVEITLEGTAYRGSLKQTTHDGVPFWFIDCPEFFDRDPLYGTEDGDYSDNSLRFGFFSRAVLEIIKRLDFRPDVIHIHDWQTCFIPVLLKTEYRNNPFYSSISTLLTIHNLGYQGLFPKSVLSQLGLSDSLSSTDQLEYFGNISALKGGIVFSDVINTVSPTYCKEIQSRDFGHGFDGILRNRKEDLHGIINGLDQRTWDPALDSALPTPFNAENLNGKRACKRFLQKELGLDLRSDVPIVAVISRLDRQKGIELIQQAWEQLLTRDIQFVLLGSGDQRAAAFWKERQGKYPGKVSINLTFDEGLSRRLYAGSDLLLVPSLYEPCGLTQMIAMHYGAVPLVRRTGGLADTVIDVSEGSKKGNGFVFNNPVPRELLAAIDRALKLYPQRNRWLTLVKRSMKADFSWTNSALQYDELYTKARKYRQIPAA